MSTTYHTPIVLLRDDRRTLTATPSASGIVLDERTRRDDGHTTHRTIVVPPEALAALALLAQARQEVRS